ncbi:hypothetical protein Gohar_022800, partial [Gossypium harknessii]|nr:hypothetical protein [Gossypium harknessii]
FLLALNQDEWQTGLKALGVDSLSKLKKALSDLEKEVEKPSNYEDFYTYAFRYCLTEEKQKSVDIESICELLNLVLGVQFRPQIDSLIEYLKVQNDYKVINSDQWINFLRFCKEVNLLEMHKFANFIFPFAAITQYDKVSFHLHWKSVLAARMKKN